MLQNSVIYWCILWQIYQSLTVIIWKCLSNLWLDKSFVTERYAYWAMVNDNNSSRIQSTQLITIKSQFNFTLTNGIWMILVGWFCGCWLNIESSMLNNGVINNSYYSVSYSICVIRPKIGIAVFLLTSSTPSMLFGQVNWLNVLFLWVVVFLVTGTCSLGCKNQLK